MPAVVESVVGLTAGPVGLPERIATVNWSSGFSRVPSSALAPTRLSGTNVTLADPGGFSPLIAMMLPGRW